MKAYKSTSAVSSLKHLGRRFSSFVVVYEMIRNLVKSYSMEFLFQKWNPPMK